MPDSVFNTTYVKMKKNFGVNNPGWQINTNWISDQDLTVSLLSDIQSEFSEITGITDVSTTLDALTSIKRYKISLEITGAEPAISIDDGAKKVNQALDTLMIQLRNNQYINNFDCSVAYFTDFSLKGNIPSATFHILGSLRDPAIPNDPVADFTFDKSVTVTGQQIQFESLSQGYIKAYDWSFLGDTPLVSNETNPAISYDEMGTYDVALTVGGKTPEITDTKTLRNAVKVYSPPTGEYCTATFGYDYSWISKVKFNDIDNPTNGFPANGYSDFSTSLITELKQDSTYPISIDLNYTNSPNRNIAVWIDFNNNGSFEDEGEQVLLAQPPQLTQLTGATISIPSNAPNVITRMRVRANYRAEGNITSCGFDNYMGETEDYAVVITNQTALNLPIASGWSGISSYIIPSNPDVTAIFDPLAASLDMLYNMDGEIYSPLYGINTIGNWNQQQGYIIKNGATDEVVFNGLYNINRTINISPGWNLIPVISNCPVDPVLLDTDISGLEMIKEVAGTDIYWPANGINTLGVLRPGFAYFLYSTSYGSFTYPTCPNTEP